MSDQLTIILLEDDQVDALAVRRAVARSGRRVNLIEYQSAAEALRDPLLQAGADGLMPLVVADLNLPGMGGLAFMRQLRSGGREGTPVVVLTTSSDERDRRAAEELHAAGYFIKPVDSAELRSLIASVIEYWFRSFGIPP